MTALTTIGGSAANLTMTSREIAELTGKEHDNVRRDVKRMAEELSLTFEEKTEASTGGRPSVVFLLPKRETLILVSGYSVELRARIIDRWQELEKQAALGQWAALIPKTMGDALRMCADQADTIEHQKAVIAEQAPKVAALERIAAEDAELNLTEAAKHLQIPPRKLTAWMQGETWIYRSNATGRWMAYQHRLQQGWLIHRMVQIRHSDGHTQVLPQVLVTPLGLTKLAGKLEPTAA